MMGGFTQLDATVLSDRSRSSRGFTLIELLAVSVIAAVAVSVLTVQLSAASAHARFGETLHHWKTIDASGRLLAQTIGKAVAIGIRDASQEDVMEARRSDKMDVYMHRTIPRHIDVRVLHPQQLNAVYLDERGRSCDYQVHIASMDADMTASLVVSGLTGWIETTRQNHRVRRGQ